MEKEECFNCKYYYNNTCRCNPPAIIYKSNNLSMNVYPEGVWPKVPRGEWCGKHERRESNEQQTTEQV